MFLLVSCGNQMISYKSYRTMIEYSILSFGIRKVTLVKVSTLINSVELSMKSKFSSKSLISIQSASGGSLNLTAF